MKTIWKAKIQPDSIKGGIFEIDITAPTGARAISVGLQNGFVMVWFEIDPDKPLGRLRLYSVGTGFGRVPDNARFIGTIIDGPYIWHIYGEV